MSSIYNFGKLKEEALGSVEECFAWLQRMKLIPATPRCRSCGDRAKLRFRGQCQVNFRCQKRAVGHVNWTKNALTGTFFEKCRLPLVKILTFMYYFSVGLTSYDHLIRETSDDNFKTSTATISDWLSFCREVCFVDLDNAFEEEDNLGGEGVVVEVDECKIGKRKYNRGRLVEGTWVLGIIEIDAGANRKKKEKRGGKFRLELCPDNRRDAETLIPLILKHVLPGTTIVTDLWRGYFNLTDQEYNHFTVNHSRNFVDPLTGANTQTIESSWRAVKRSLRTGIPADKMADHLAEYLWRRRVARSGADAFAAFLNAVKSVYPGQ